MRTTILIALSITCLCLPGILLATDTAFVPVKDYVPFRVRINGTAYAQDASSRIDICSDSVLRVYAIPSNQLRKSIRCPSLASLLTYSYAAGPRGYLVLQSNSGYYKVAIESGTITRIFPFTPSSIVSVKCFSEGMRKALYLGKDSLVHIADTLVNSSPRLFGDSGRGISYAVFSPDNKRVASLKALDSSLQIWDADADTIIVSRHLPFTVIEIAGFTTNGDKIFFPIKYRKTSKYEYAIIDARNGGTLEIDSFYVNDKLLNWNYYTDIQFSTDDSLVLINNFIIRLSAKKCVAYYAGPSPSSGWYFNRRWFSKADTSVLIPNYNGSLETCVLYELSAKNGLVSTRYMMQERPDVRFSGFNDKGEAIFIGRYSYRGSSSITGDYWIDSTLYWSAETNEEIMSRVGVTHSATADHELEQYFSPDGKRMFQEHWNVQMDNNFLMGIDILNIADRGRLVCSARGLRSQDNRSVCEFYDSTVKIIDATTGAATSMPFRLPPRWKPFAVAPQLSIVCACSTSQASRDSDVVYILRVWNLRTNAVGNTMYIDRLNWMDNHYRWDIPRILISPDGSHLVISSVNGTNVFETSTSTRVWDYAGNHVNTALTPDGRFIITGNGCYSATTGELLRVYSGMSSNDLVSFNPLNNRQFMAGSRVWELPNPTQRVSNPLVQVQSRGLICNASKRNLIIELPFVALGEKSSMKLYRLDGSCVMRKDERLDGKRAAIEFHGLASGTYLFSIGVPARSFSGRGKFTVP